MGNFAALMKSVLRAMMRSSTWLWERCANTGRLVGRLMMVPFDALGGGGVSMPDDPEPSAEEIATQRAQAADLHAMEAIKQLANQILAHEINPETVKRVSKDIAGRWHGSCARSRQRSMPTSRASA